jgi:hypothetical protein
MNGRMAVALCVFLYSPFRNYHYRISCGIQRSDIFRKIEVICDFCKTYSFVSISVAERISVNIGDLV